MLSPPRSLLLYFLLTIPLMVAALTACGGDDDDDPVSTGPSATPTTPALEGEILVFAASSLTEAFKEVGGAFQSANPKAKVTFNFAASSALATQINEGARADVFASADNVQMKVVTDKGNASEPRVFVKNVPVVVVSKGSSTVSVFSDLARAGLKLVLAAPEVPVGRYSRDILGRASVASGGISPDFSDRVLANLKSNEPNVRAVLAKVQLGEADAGIVYRTDIAAAGGEVAEIVVPPQYNVIAEYPIAVVGGSRKPAVAAAFVAFILTPTGQAILQKAGFTAP